jgi:hypothetical protein
LRLGRFRVEDKTIEVEDEGLDHESPENEGY